MGLIRRNTFFCPGCTGSCLCESQSLPCPAFRPATPHVDQRPSKPPFPFKTFQLLRIVNSLFLFFWSGRPIAPEKKQGARKLVEAIKDQQRGIDDDLGQLAGESYPITLELFFKVGVAPQILMIKQTSW